jgi:hypothetical protein
MTPTTMSLLDKVARLPHLIHEHVPTTPTLQAQLDATRAAAPSIDRRIFLDDAARCFFCAKGDFDMTEILWLPPHFQAIWMEWTVGELQTGAWVNCLLNQEGEPYTHMTSLWQAHTSSLPMFMASVMLCTDETGVFQRTFGPPHITGTTVPRNVNDITAHVGVLGIGLASMRRAKLGSRVQVCDVPHSRRERVWEWRF